GRSGRNLNVDVDCGVPPEIEHSSVMLVDNLTTNGAKAIYQCAENYAIIGEVISTCGGEGHWSQPGVCLLFSDLWCPELESKNKSSIQMSGNKTSGYKASFTCEAGHMLIGNKSIFCALGGTWSGKPPQCHFINCGHPENLRDGQMILVNHTTYLNSIAMYECGEDFLINGPEERICMDDGHWSSMAPICMKKCKPGQARCG
ncbi:unnamed protein product, partial [Meganyctiphanes norvegica]